MKEGKVQEEIVPNSNFDNGFISTDEIIIKAVTKTAKVRIFNKDSINDGRSFGFNGIVELEK